MHQGATYEGTLRLVWSVGSGYSWDSLRFLDDISTTSSMEIGDIMASMEINEFYDSH